jgi:hypothetical protein
MVEIIEIVINPQYATCEGDSRTVAEFSRVADLDFLQ